MGDTGVSKIFGKSKLSFPKAMKSNIRKPKMACCEMIFLT